QYCNNFSIVAYIRPQHELAISLHNTALRLGYYNRRILPDHKKPEPYYDYRSMLERWSDVFGKEHVVPKIYDKNSFHNNDIVSDFFKFCGITWDGLKKLESSNASLSGEAQAFLEGIN